MHFTWLNKFGGGSKEKTLHISTMDTVIVMITGNFIPKKIDTYSGDVGGMNFIQNNTGVLSQDSIYKQCFLCICVCPAGC